MSEQEIDHEAVHTGETPQDKETSGYLYPTLFWMENLPQGEGDGVDYYHDGTKEGGIKHLRDDLQEAFDAGYGPHGSFHILDRLPTDTDPLVKASSGEVLDTYRAAPKLRDADQEALSVLEDLSYLVNDHGDEGEQARWMDAARELRDALEQAGVQA